MLSTVYVKPKKEDGIKERRTALQPNKETCGKITLDYFRKRGLPNGSRLTDEGIPTKGLS
jgi:hypothetical protein